MADDDKTQDEPTTKGAPAAIDQDALLDAVGRRVQDSIREGLHGAAQNAQAQVQPRKDPLREMLLDAAGGDLVQARLLAESASDKADFYTDADDDEVQDRKSHKADVEKLFQDSIKNGRPMPRADLWKWYKGQHFDKFEEKRAKRKADKLEAASAQNFVGEGARTRQASSSDGKDPYEMDEETLDKATANRFF